MENAILESLAISSIDIQQRIRAIEQRIRNKKPGFRSTPPPKITNPLLSVQQCSSQAIQQIDSLPWKISVLESSKHSLDEMLSETVNRSIRLRSDLKNMADRLGCEDQSSSVGNYIAVLKIPLKLTEETNQKFPYSDRKIRHSRNNTEGQAFESENCHKSTDKNRKQQLFPTSDWDFKSDISYSDRKFQQTPSAKQPSLYVQPQQYLTMLNKTDLTGIQFSKEVENDLTFNSCSILQNLEPRELKIASVNEYMQQYLSRKKQQQNYKSKPAFLKYIDKMEKRITEVASPVKETSVRVRSASIVDKELVTGLELQLSMREKLLRRIYQMRDRERYR